MDPAEFAAAAALQSMREAWLGASVYIARIWISPWPVEASEETCLSVASRLAEAGFTGYDYLELGLPGTIGELSILAHTVMPDGDERGAMLAALQKSMPPGQSCRIDWHLIAPDGWAPAPEHEHDPD